MMKHYIVLFFIRIGIQFFRLVPFRLLYILSDILYFIFRYVIRYRRKVMKDNLTQSFPKYTDAQIEVVLAKAYQNLCDVTLEAVKGLTLSQSQIMVRYRITNPELLDEAFAKKQSVILTGAHYANWEWGVRSWSLWFRHIVIGIYKPLGNKTVEAYLNARRADFGMQLAGPKETRKVIGRAHIESCMYVLMGDQSPHNLNTCHWVNFFHRETAWLQGVAEIAQQQNFSIYYLDTQRIKRGFYESKIILLQANPNQSIAHDISAQYAAKVEHIITQKPENWLWSHRRWKHRRA